VKRLGIPKALSVQVPSYPFGWPVGQPWGSKAQGTGQHGARSYLFYQFYQLLEDDIQMDLFRVTVTQSPLVPVIACFSSSTISASIQEVGAEGV